MLPERACRNYKVSAFVAKSLQAANSGIDCQELLASLDQALKVQQLLYLVQVELAESLTHRKLFQPFVRTIDCETEITHDVRFEGAV
jgi:hypothetical protein